MLEFPTAHNKLIQAINHCTKQNNGHLYIHGNSVLFKLTSDSYFLKEQLLKLVVSYEKEFNTANLHQCLISHITVHKEIENSISRYQFIANKIEIIIDLVKDFDPTRLSQTKQFGVFNIESVFIDAETNELKTPLEVSSLNPIVLKNLKPLKEWDLSDIAGFIKWSGTIPETMIDQDQLQYLRNISLSGLKEPLEISWNEIIEQILLLRRSGAALRFMTNTFIDGVAWTFKTLVDYVIGMNISISEETNIDTLLNDKKFQIIDLYNEFFLDDKVILESRDEVYHRLNLLLKVLFDSPNMNIPKPFINKIRAMSAGALGRCCLGSDVGGTIAFFGCGNNLEEEECLGLPVNCSDNNLCLREHTSFIHIPTENWDAISVNYREWCPDQACPEADNIHCLKPLEELPITGTQFLATKDLTIVGRGTAIFNQGAATISDFGLIAGTSSESAATASYVSVEVGSEIVIGSSYSAMVLYALLQFDLSSIPLTSTVTSAVLHLNGSRKINPQIRCKIRRMTTVTWNEETTTWETLVGPNGSLSDIYTTNDEVTANLPIGDPIIGSPIPSNNTSPDFYVRGMEVLTQDAISNRSGQLSIIIMFSEEMIVPPSSVALSVFFSKEFYSTTPSVPAGSWHPEIIVDWTEP